MDRITQVFNHLDYWRQLPDYQLERRADLYFSLYLPEVLEACLGSPVWPTIVPEFPIKQAQSNRSDKVDYLAATADRKRLVLVELKTDCQSTRREQFEYLCSGAQKSGVELLDDLHSIRRASKAQGKYDALLAATAELGMSEDSAQGMRGNHAIVLVTPNEEFRYREEAEGLFRKANVPFHVVTFNAFRAIVLNHGDPLSVRFAESLKCWSKNLI